MLKFIANCGAHGKGRLSDLNTSHVEVYHVTVFMAFHTVVNLNTSHVEVYLLSAHEIVKDMIEFKYISC